MIMSFWLTITFEPMHPDSKCLKYWWLGHYLSLRLGMTVHYIIPSLLKLTRHAAKIWLYASFRTITQPCQCNLLHVLLLFISKSLHLSVHCHELLNTEARGTTSSTLKCLDVQGVLAAKPPFLNTAFPLLPKNRSKHLLTGAEQHTNQLQSYLHNTTQSVSYFRGGDEQA